MVNPCPKSQRAQRRRTRAKGRELGSWRHPQRSPTTSECGAGALQGRFGNILWVGRAFCQLGKELGCGRGAGEGRAAGAELSLPLLSPSSVQDYPKAGPERARGESEAADEEEEEEEES